jgi:hypothetical protein
MSYTITTLHCRLQCGPLLPLVLLDITKNCNLLQMHGKTILWSMQHLDLYLNTLPDLHIFLYCLYSSWSTEVEPCSRYTRCLSNSFSTRTLHYRKSTMTSIVFWIPRSFVLWLWKSQPHFLENGSDTGLVTGRECRVHLQSSPCFINLCVLPCPAFIFVPVVR